MMAALVANDRTNHRRRSPRIAKAGAILLLTGGATFADAAPKSQEKKISILPIVLGRPSGLSPSTLYDAAIRVTRERLDVSVISDEERFVKSQDGLKERVRACGSDGACIASRLRTINAELGLVILLNAEIQPPLLSVRLLDTDARAELSRALVELPDAAPKTVTPAVARSVGTLFDRAGFVRSARLVIAVEPPDAAISIDPPREPNPGAPHVFTVPAGQYRVAARLPDHADAFEQVIIDPGEERNVRLTLARERSFIQNPWLWVGVAAVTVAAGAVTIWAVNRTPENRLCISVDGRVNPACGN